MSLAEALEMRKGPDERLPLFSRGKSLPSRERARTHMKKRSRKKLHVGELPNTVWTSI